MFTLLPVALILTVVIWFAVKFFGRTEKLAHGEWLTIGIITLLLGVSAYSWGSWKIDYAMAQTNMEFAFRQCGEMLKNGEKKALQDKLAELLASPVMEQGGIRIAQAFRQSLAGEIKPDPFGVIGAALCLNFFLIWCGMALVWGILYGCKLTRARKVFQVCCGVFAILTFLPNIGARMVNGGYFSAHVRFDLERLQRELRLPEVRPELMSALEHPQINSYSFFRELPPERQAVAPKNKGDRRKTHSPDALPVDQLVRQRDGLRQPPVVEPAL